MADAALFPLARQASDKTRRLAWELLFLEGGYVNPLLSFCVGSRSLMHNGGHVVTAKHKMMLLYEKLEKEKTNVHSTGTLRWRSICVVRVTFHEQQAELEVLYLEDGKET